MKGKWEMQLFSDEMGVYVQHSWACSFAYYGLSRCSQDRILTKGFLLNQMLIGKVIMEYI